MTGLPGRLRVHSRPGGDGWRRRAVRRLGEVAEAAIGPAEVAQQQQDVLRRAAIAPIMIGVVTIDHLRFPGWQVVVVACLVAIAYDLLLAYLVFAKKQAFAARVLAFVLDGALLSGASLFVLRAMGEANSTSDLWLAFVVFVVSGGFALAPVGSLIYTTLTMGFFALGTLLYFSPDSQYHDQLPIRLVFFAMFGLISMAMAQELEKRRAKLGQQNRQTMAMLATLVEARDTDAGAHLHRIQHFSQALALHLGFSHKEAQDIADASLLHDIGKANVPDAILKKPGPLNPDEWRTMQRHTLWGDALLTDHHDFQTARWVARSHHEHWDGSGYPDGLAGDHIPLPARMVAVADVFDALISHRPYKQPWPPHAAILELQRMAGSHLDPTIVGAFVELWDQGVIATVIEDMRVEEVVEKALPRAA